MTTRVFPQHFGKSLVPSTRILLALFLGACLFAPSGARAQFTWSNPAGGSWSAGGAGGNWNGDAAPVPGGGLSVSLTFGTAGTQAASYTANNDLAGTFDLNLLTINNTSGTVTLTGNALNFTGTNPGISVLGAGNLIINNPFNFAATTTISGAGTVTIGGLIGGGTFDLNKTNAGSLTLSGGGTMNRLSLQAGNTFITGGTLALTAPTGTNNNDAGLQLGTATGQTVAVTISNGAVVNVTENIYAADVAGSTGTITVTGAGSVLNNAGGTSGRFGVGNNGVGTLNITNGGVVNTLIMFQSRSAGSTGTILVDGVGSQINAVATATVGTGAFNVGSQSVGTMTIQNGGSATSRTLVIGNTGTTATTGAGDGFLTVTGAGSTFTVGSAAAGTQATQISIASGTAGQTGTTTGRLDILNGAVVTVNRNGAAPPASGNLFAAIRPGTVATLNVGGTNSRLSVINQFTLSGGGGTGVDGGSATMNINSGGTVQVGGTTLFGQNAGGSTTVTVDGAGSNFTGTGSIQMNNGTVNVTVQNSGTFTNGTTMFLSGTTGATVVNVTGTGSTFTSVGNVAVAGSNSAGAGTPSTGTAVLNVGNGGTVNLNSLATLYGPGTLNLNTGGNLSVGALNNGVAATSMGTVNLAANTTLNIVNGTGTFDGLIAGAGAINKNGTGIQTLGGTNTFSGGTTVTSGTLAVTTATALGTGSITVSTGATLTGTGLTVTVPANATLSGAGTITADSIAAGPNTTVRGGAPGTTGTLNITGNVTATTGATGAGSQRTQVTFNNSANSLIAVTGQVNFVDPAGTNDPFIIDVRSAGLTPNVSVTRTIITATGGFFSNGTGPLPAGTNFLPADYLLTSPDFSSFTGVTLGTGANSNDLVLTFTPVPEPATVLGVAALGALAVRLRRRFV